MGSVDALWCLGDIVGYAAEPNECVARLRELGARCVVGNHDWAVIGRASIEDFNDHAAGPARWTAEALAPGTGQWLADCPQVGVGGERTRVHASPYDPSWEYVASARVAARSLTHVHTQVCFVGHTHIP